MNNWSFSVTHRDKNARTGELTTAHGTIPTPAFMPVGTAATVKAMTPESVATTGAAMILANTYHLMLRPGAEIIYQLGGLHTFMNWPHPILTDSGGFQVMSLAKIRTITEQGVAFSSHIDGSQHMLTPEKSVHIQHLLGSDITMVFDECTPYPATHEQAQQSMELSLRWAHRSKEAFRPRTGYGIFGIVQGSIYEDLRIASSYALQEIGFDGYAVGGLAVGEGQQRMLSTLEKTLPTLPSEKPRYLMGVGKPSDIIGAIEQGIDMFDCVLPTRSGRNGQAFTDTGPVNIRNAKYKKDETPLSTTCPCPACKNYSKAYLNHLVRSGEILGAMLMTWHNIQYYQDLLKKIRTAIASNNFDDFKEAFLRPYKS